MKEYVRPESELILLCMDENIAASSMKMLGNVTIHTSGGKFVNSDMDVGGILALDADAILEKLRELTYGPQGDMSTYGDCWA